MLGEALVVSYKHSIQENAEDSVTECLPIIRRITEEKHNCPGTLGIQPEVGSSRKSRKFGSVTETLNYFQVYLQMH